MPVRGDGMVCPPASLVFTSSSCHLGLPGAIQDLHLPFGTPSFGNGCATGHHPEDEGEETAVPHLCSPLLQRD